MEIKFSTIEVFDDESCKDTEYQMLPLVLNTIDFFEQYKPEVKEAVVIKPKHNVSGRVLYEMRAFCEAGDYRMELMFDYSGSILLSKVKITNVKLIKTVQFLFNDWLYEVKADDLTNGFYFSLMRSIRDAVREFRKKRYDEAREAIDALKGIVHNSGAGSSEPLGS